MDNKFLRQLIEKLNTDPDFCNELFKKQTIDEMYEFASNKISGYTKQEFIEAMKLLEKNSNQNAKLADNELDEVVGGVGIAAQIGATILTTFVDKGGPTGLQNISYLFKKKKAEKAYKEYLKNNNLTEDELKTQLLIQTQEQSINAQIDDILKAFKYSLV